MNCIGKTALVLICMVFFAGFSLQNKPCGNSPELNQKIIAFVKANMGKTLGKGECWDVANAALNAIGAKWDKKFGFGKMVDYKSECVYPGDIIQLKDALMHDEPRKGLHVYDEYPQHTAIIMQVYSKQVYQVADQNFGLNKRFLNTHNLNLFKLEKGSVQVYRPVK
ncbi:MAG TPA: hypothetical protein PLQ93_06705 [Bacteroidia bacterium]|nr:hypothetical protein [Bacteroidia bacterium]